MRFRIDITLPEFDYDGIEGHEIEEEECEMEDEGYEQCEECGKRHDPQEECKTGEMISTEPIKELVQGRHSGLLEKMHKMDMQERPMKARKSVKKKRKGK